MLKRKLLIVDDQQINRKILNKLLSDEYDVLEAGNGEEALTVMRSNRDISAVILDIMMPVMDGYEVLRHIAKDRELVKIPVIVSSQKDGDEAELKALALGANDFIAKPYKAEIIHRRLANMIKLRETAALINKTERDEITGLYNKQFFLAEARELLQKTAPQKYDMICIGIERFKLVNDTYGEHTGDKVLHHIADVIRSMRTENMIFGRFMQDEFYIMLPHKDERDPEIFFEAYRKVNEYPIDMEIKLHTGIYYITGAEESVTNMCDSAKLASDENRGKYDLAFSYYDDSIRQKLVEEQFVLSNMQEALETHQFKVYYQPKYDLNTELIVGAEALIRWVHPDRGIISPGVFIPIFEKNGFITNVDKYVWETVCQDMREWMDAGLPAVAVSVNVSRVDIYSPKLVDTILNLVAKYKININQLHLEITESAYTENSEQIIDVVSRFRDLGFVIEMDDFGSGYSSLNMLAMMPVDVLKLDMKFVQTEQQTINGKGIMSFVISLAKWMNLRVIAEGVENSEQIATLRSMDCNYVQGYYYAKPMTLRDFKLLLESSRVSVGMNSNPIRNTMSEYVDEEHSSEKKKAGRVMLIVDDMEANSTALASIFVNDYVIVTKENGQEAWDYLQDNAAKVDVIMLDLMMPVMDGFHLLKLIRSTADTKNIPVIITSQGNQESEQRALELKADDFISKPYKAELIRHRVHNVAPKYKEGHLPKQDESFSDFARLEEQNELSPDDKIRLYLKAQEPHFDIVRLVQPEYTLICERPGGERCENEFCFSVWGKQARCSNCISLKALQKRGRCNKLEYSRDGLFFVISEYVPFGKEGAVVEMVTKLDDEYIDNVFEKDLLYGSLDELQHQIEYDPLTGVYNRRHLDKHLNTYVEAAKKRRANIGIAMVDVDSFKALNDTKGHFIGDAALKEIANILQSNIALSKGDFVARFGGDEFTVVCRDIPEEIFRQRMNVILQLVAHLKIEGTENEFMSVSIGGTNLSEHVDKSAIELMKLADHNLYKAKHHGKNYLVIE